MANSLLIPIGAAGIYNVAAPFDVRIQKDTAYTCKAARKLSDIISEGFDPYERYYQDLQISPIDYQLDVDADVAIISLYSANGQWAYIPSTKIINYPSVNGVTYHSLVLGISLGALPDTALLDSLKTSVTNLVNDTLGVDSVIKEVVVSPPAIVPYDDYVLIENARKAKITIFQTDRARLLTAQTDLQLARDKIAVLEKYIRDNQPK